jgi:uncharacterized Zn finger protein
MPWWRYYTPKPAREVQGGIKAQSRRGAFATTWWGQRWLKVLESFDIGERLSRGRTYARKGQVMDIEIAPGAVKARVQGSRTRPYKVEVRFKPLARTQWRQVAKTLSGRFITLAKLLAGELPEEIEALFTSAQAPLFPQKLRDLTTDCTCPDWSNPCKHTAAVFYLLAEEFDRDPFLLFKLRGLSRQELFELLGYGHPDTQALPEPGRIDMGATASEEPPCEPASFWGDEDLPDDLFGEVKLPEIAAALPRRLGNFPFWRGKVPFLEALEPVYRQVAPLGLDVVLGQYKPVAEEPLIPEKPAKPIPKSPKRLTTKPLKGRRSSATAVPKKKPRGK